MFSKNKILFFILSIMLFGSLSLIITCYQGTVEAPALNISEPITNTTDTTTSTTDTTSLTVTTNETTTTTSTTIPTTTTITTTTTTTTITTTTTTMFYFNVELSPLELGSSVEHKLKLYLYDGVTPYDPYTIYSTTKDYTNNVITGSVPYIPNTTVIAFIYRYSPSTNLNPTNYNLKIIYEGATTYGTQLHEDSVGDFGCVAEAPTEPSSFPGNDENGSYGQVFDPCNTCCNLGTTVGIDISGSVSISSTWYSDNDYYRFIIN